MTQRLDGLAAVLTCSLVVACGGPRAGGERDGGELLADSRRIAAEAKQRFAAALARSLDAGNILRSFSTCRYESMEILSEVSRANGVRVARVSLSPRNPALASADAWEQRVLHEFQWRRHVGEEPDVLEHAEFVDEPAGRVYRYMVAVPVQRRCMHCHGPEATLTAAVREKLAADYPAARGQNGFEVGGVGGAISIIRSW